jgi:hypothetical protein
VLPTLPETRRYVFLVPVNPLAKFSPNRTVSVFPEPLADEFAALSTHWLFCNVALVPPWIGPNHTRAASSPK